MRWAGIVAAVIAATVDVLYLGYVNVQSGSDPQFLRVPFVAMFIALMAISAALSIRASAARCRPLLLGIAAGGLLLLGFYAIFSIGFPLLVAGVAALTGLLDSLSRGGAGEHESGRPARVWMAVGGGLSSVAVLLTGFTVTEFAIRCPPSGLMSGGGISALGTTYSYSCYDGRLTITR